MSRSEMIEKLAKTAYPNSPSARAMYTRQLTKRTTAQLKIMLAR